MQEVFTKKSRWNLWIQLAYYFIPFAYKSIVIANKIFFNFKFEDYYFLAWISSVSIIPLNIHGQYRVTAVEAYSLPANTMLCEIMSLLIFFISFKANFLTIWKS